MKVYVVSHILPIYNLPESYEFILGGSFNKEHENRLGYLTHDHLPGNISSKNKWYSELSSLYAINQLTMSDNFTHEFVGLTHYRRFFLKKRYMKFLLKLMKLKQNIFNINLEPWKISHCLFDGKSIPLNNSNLVYVAEPKVFSCNVYEQYAQFHDINDLKTTFEYIIKNQPEYEDAILAVKKQSFLYCYNMFVAHKNILNNYCNWLFPVLKKLEKLIDLDAKAEYQERVFGYLAERLFNVWLTKNRDSLDIQTLPIYMIKLRF